tara:strand:- start:424 stop:678 length:255 start_codon:yes stop_codon:yes gene_type:complete
MSYPLSKSDDEERNQLIKIANGSIQGEEAEAILTKLFPLRSIMYTQEDAEYVLSMVYGLKAIEIDRVMMAFPPQFCFSDYFQED